jgi:hypothetical protein
LPGSTYIDVSFRQDQQFYNPGWIDWVFYYLDELGDFHFNYFDTGANVSKNDSFILNNALTGIHQTLIPFEIDVVTNRIKFLHSIRWEHTYLLDIVLTTPFTAQYSVLEQNSFVISYWWGQAYTIPSNDVSVLDATKWIHKVPYLWIFNIAWTQRIWYHLGGTGWVYDDTTSTDFLQQTVNTWWNTWTWTTLTGSLQTWAWILEDIFWPDFCSWFWIAINPICWLGAILDWLSTVFNQFTSRLGFYAQFFDFSLTTEDYDFTLSLPTWSLNLSWELYVFTIPYDPYIPTYTWLWESADPQDWILKYILLAFWLVGYIWTYLFILFGIVFILWSFLAKTLYQVANSLTGYLFDSVWSTTNKGDYNLISFVTGLAFFGVMIAFIDSIFIEYTIVLQNAFESFKQIFWHILHYTISTITAWDVLFIPFVNAFQVFFVGAIVLYLTYFLVSKFVKL